MKRKKRLQTGKFITQNRLPKEKPTLAEIAAGQTSYDVVNTKEKSSGSPYWDWMERHGQQTEDGDIIEGPIANPDLLVAEPVPTSNSPIPFHVVKSLLTAKQWAVIKLYIDGFTQGEIASNLQIDKRYVNKVIKTTTEKLQKYLFKKGDF